MKKNQRPAAWLHTMDCRKDGGNLLKQVTFTKGNPWGKPGVDYSAEYPVKSVPLYRAAARR